MSESTFTHLHLHSQYSLLDGAIRLKKLFPRLKEFGMKSVALTDHGNMFGAVDFYKGARAAGIKAIFGCEVYVTDDMRDRTHGRDSYHLILLAKNMEGYQNLSYMVSMGYLEGFYYSPRVDKKLLREHSSGLIAMTACLGGEIPQTIMQKGVAKAEQVVLEYADIFEKDSFFLEIQANGMTEQDEVNDALIKLSAKLNLPLVASNDCHYLNREDAQAHDILMCIQTGKNVDDADRLKHSVDQYYLKSPEEMETAFRHVPQALENTARIADMCNVELSLGKEVFLPRYKVPPELTLDDFFAQKCREGLDLRFKQIADSGRKIDEDRYRERLEKEIQVIQQMKFPGYFLIVWDFIKFAKSKGIPVGPGRGSGAGSMAAYALRITDIDPLPYNLLFERFLNPERVSMPDFDIDFCMNRRNEVIEYVTEKYGKSNVGQIVTFHQLKPKGVVRDVARVMGLSYQDGDRVAKLIPDPIQGKTKSIPEYLEEEPRLREMAEAEPQIARLLQVASALEGLNRHAGMHAAGVVIGEKPLWEHVPCFRGQNGEIVTQYAKTEVEEVGLVKFDFLGLRTLTVIEEAVRLIRQHTPDFRVDTAPLDDPKTYELLQAGNVTAVFQLDASKGIKDLMKKLKPDCLEDIIAAVALYRPGPLEGGMVDDFVSRKHGRTKVDYLHPWLEQILKETYGVIVYQEQVMQIASALAGYSLGQADLLRRAMGKKKVEEMAKQKACFLEGAKTKGVDLTVAETIFDLMEKFAGYGFNKSHSAAYAMITFQTAYLKAHYPVEFMAGVLTCEKDNADNLVKFIAEARAMDIEVLRPELNESEADFSVVTIDGKKCIRFGLAAVRNVGAAAVEPIMAARAEKKFTSLYDFCERIDMRKVNKRVIEALIKSGAFDSLAENKSLSRARLMGALDIAQERATAAQRDRECGQTSLFGMLESAAQSSKNGADEIERYPEVVEWDPRQRLFFEKENLGFYFSGHPLDRYDNELKRHASTTIEQLVDLPENTEVTIGGLVAEYRERPLKSGLGRMAIFKLEDKTGAVETVAFSKQFMQYEQIFKADEPILVSAALRFEGDSEESRAPKLHLREAVTMPELRKQKTSECHLHLQVAMLQNDRIAKLKEVLLQHVGDCRTMIHLTIPHHSKTKMTLSERYWVSPTDELLSKLERLFGEKVVVLR